MGCHQSKSSSQKSQKYTLEYGDKNRKFSSAEATDVPMSFQSHQVLERRFKLNLVPCFQGNADAMGPQKNRTQSIDCQRENKPVYNEKFSKSEKFLDLKCNQVKTPTLKKISLFDPCENNDIVVGF